MSTKKNENKGRLCKGLALNVLDPERARMMVKKREAEIWKAKLHPTNAAAKEEKEGN